MNQYMIQLSYHTHTWRTLVEVPQNRKMALEGCLESLGGSIDAWWLTFGDYDVMALVNLPDSVSAAAMAMAIRAGGAVKEMRTTALISLDDEMEAMRRAAQIGYEPPL